MNNSPAFALLLDDLAVLRASGADAADFLHGQLTQDIAGLPPGRARLAAYCTPKGRVLATLIILRDPDNEESLLALVKADIAAPLVKRLSMFVLRAKAKLEVSDLKVLGISTAPKNSDSTVSLTPPANGATWSVVKDAQGIWINAPAADASEQRWWLITPGHDPAPASSSQQDAWKAADIEAGLPWIETATQDVFIPQTLNLDLIDGVNFTKGCYPGQEVVARSHYRGIVKRRMAYGVADTTDEIPVAGTDIYDAERPESPSGRVINAAARAGQTHLLLEVHLSDMSTAQYRLGSAEGTPIALHPLPYAIEHIQET